MVPTFVEMKWEKIRLVGWWLSSLECCILKNNECWISFQNIDIFYVLSQELNIWDNLNTDSDFSKSGFKYLQKWSRLI